MAPDFLKTQQQFKETPLCRNVFADLSGRLIISKENNFTPQRQLCCSVAEMVILPYSAVIFRLLLFWRANLVQREAGRVFVHASLRGLSPEPGLPQASWADGGKK